MPTEDKSFDAHLGSLISSLARLKGGRSFVADLLGLDVKTITRRAAGNGEYSVRELNLVADAFGMTANEILSLALRNYSGGTSEDGVRKLVTESKAVSEPPTNLDHHRLNRRSAPKGKRPSDMTEEELDAFEGEQAANRDPEIGHDESQTP